MSEAIEEQAGKNPSVVLEAFLPRRELSVSVATLLLMERLGSPFVLGGDPTFKDIVLAWLAMTDYEACRAAQRDGGVEDYMDRVTGDIPPSEFLALGPKIEAAVQAAFAPMDSGAESEKKTSRPSAGG